MPYDRILELMSPPGQDRIYVLGAYARRVTIYSQQVRAINLVDAIQFHRKDLKGQHIAVVGGGIAGLTAAARALSHGAKVSVIEQSVRLISVQSDAKHRWVHPHLYEWPIESTGHLLEADAGLPVMNWSAQNADQLAKHLETQWSKLAKKHNDAAKNTVTEYKATKVAKVTPDHESVELLLVDRERKSSRPAKFDIVIFAMGYGLEPQAAGKDSYWRSDGWDFAARPEEERILVAGYGDGALTDLMRACLKQFDHQKILTDVVEALSDEDIARIRELEAGIEPGDADLLSEEYEELELPAVQDVLRDQISNLRHVVLTGQGAHLFIPGASTLNRLIVSQLLCLKAFRHVPLGDNERIVKADGADPAVARILNEVRAKDESFSEFSRILLRFGTEKILPSGQNDPIMAEVGGAPLIEGMPQTLMAMRELWEDLRPEDDPTRRPLWPLVKPVWDSVTTAGGFRPQSEHVDRYCLTVEAGGAQEAQPWLRNRISEACTKLRRAQKLDFEFEQVVLQADGCVGSQEAIAFVTRLLCRAPVVVFNLGGKLGRNSPALMMLLGIRAAVRRGLTVVVVGEKPDWAELPFNIKELHVLSLLQEDEETLSTVMSSGWTQLQQQSSTYRDMPVFDTVRQFGRRTLGSPTGKIEVFALCSFGTDYLDKTFRDLRSFVASASDDESSDDEGIYDLRPANDYLSPMLAGEKIYDLARFSECCLVDWTEWKANVFFELGVRLAVHRSAPICVIKKDQLRAKNRSTNLLSALSPLVYDPKDYRGGAFPAAFRKAERDLAKKSRSNLIYIAAERNAAVSYEMGSFPFVHEMVSQIREMVGDVKQRAGVFFLYDGNPGLAHQVWTSLIDRLTAADLLISHKLPLHAVGSEDHERLTRDGDYVRATLDRLRKIGKERGYASAAGAGDAR